MHSSRGKSGAPPCTSYDINGDVATHHQWHARNVYGFIIKWYVCEFCGLTMHQLPPVHSHSDYEFIPPLVIQELGVRPEEAT